MKTVLLLIPGMLNTAQVWAEVAAHIGDAAQVRVADVLTQSSIADMAADAWALLARDEPGAAPGEPVRRVVCGFSMGGYVALHMLATQGAASPQASGRHIDALALLSTSARPESPEGAAVREKTIAAIGRDFARVVDGVASFATHASTQADAARMAAIRALMLAVGADTAVRQNRAIMARADHRELLRRLDLPTRVICGRDDRITPPALSEELAALIPGAQLRWIEPAGHMAPLEQPAQVAAALRELL